MARRSMLLGSTCIFRGKLGLMLSSLASTGPLAPGFSHGLACLWSITLAAIPGHLLDFKMMTLFGCGAVLLRDAGCTINDLLDRDIDTMVTPTVPLNNYSRVLGASSLLLVFSYPLMKRFTFWPQAYPGLTFNWGALLGCAAVKGSVDPTVVLPLYFSGVCWTLLYDTIYAHQDKKDDLKVGVKSTALRFGDSTEEWITGFGIMCMSSLALRGYTAEIGWPYYAFLSDASGQLAWQIWTAEAISNRRVQRAENSPKIISNRGLVKSEKAPRNLKGLED